MSSPVITEVCNYTVKFDEDSKELLLSQFVRGKVLGCTLDHFLPQYVGIRLNFEAERMEAAFRAFIHSPPRGQTQRYLNHRDVIVPDAIQAEVRVEFGDELALILLESPELTHELTIADWLANIRRLPSTRERTRIYQWLRSSSLRLHKHFKTNEVQHFLRLNAVPQPLQESIDYLGRYLSTSLKYVGPLRVEPRPLYELSSSADATDVGTRGEYTAAVLDLNRDVEVEYITPVDVATAASNPTPKVAPLAVAVSEWLRYMDLSLGVETRDLGPLGHELRVNNMYVDGPLNLTQVGVGVSQLLPIVTACLLADPGALLIFEQPELHLHPKIQSRLADLFLSTSRMGVQCLIETHSEYLVNGIRLRSALSEDSTWLTDNVKMYFSEIGENGSKYRNVSLNEFGALSEWPKGFFDENQLQSEAIIMAAMKKRRGRNG